MHHNWLLRSWVCVMSSDCHRKQIWSFRWGCADPRTRTERRDLRARRTPHCFWHLIHSSSSCREVFIKQSGRAAKKFPLPPVPSQPLWDFNHEEILLSCRQSLLVSRHPEYLSSTRWEFSITFQTEVTPNEKYLSWEHPECSLSPVIVSRGHEHHSSPLKSEACSWR